MSTEIYIVSGFLGAGKTTLIQQMLKNAFQNKKIALVENDFGEISIDAALLRSGGVVVQEMNSGCICCSLSGDFVSALSELIDQYHPDAIIIEPSGVGKLSDVVKACQAPSLLPVVTVRRSITVVDAKRCNVYLNNFGEFFEDQIQHADAIVIGRTQDFPDRLAQTEALIRDLNPHALVFHEPWDAICINNLLYQTNTDEHCAHGSHGDDCSCGHDHLEHACNCDHNHAAEDVFDSVTIHTSYVFSIEDLRSRIAQMERNSNGGILRLKGFANTQNGFVNLQYVPGDLRISSCADGDGVICAIGSQIDRTALSALFYGD